MILDATGHCPHLSAPDEVVAAIETFLERESRHLPADDARLLFEQALRDDDPQTLYDQAPCGYLTIHPDGHVLKANRTFQYLTGHPDDTALVGRLFTDLLAVGSRMFFETHLRPLLHLTARSTRSRWTWPGRTGRRSPSW